MIGMLKATCMKVAKAIIEKLSQSLAQQTFTKNYMYTYTSTVAIVATF